MYFILIPVNSEKNRGSAPFSPGGSDPDLPWPRINRDLIRFFWRFGYSSGFSQISQNGLEGRIRTRFSLRNV